MTNVAHQKTHLRKPVPVDVWAVDFNWPEDSCGFCEDPFSYLNAVDKSRMQCYACGKLGHLARECMSKGKGKGGSVKGFGKGGFKGGKDGKGYAKGFGKPGPKGDPAKGGKGFNRPWNFNHSGKGGYQGICYRCGQVGHKQSECGRAINEVEDATLDGELGSVEVTVVWDVCQVREAKPVSVWNRFGALQCDDEDVEEISNLEFPNLREDVPVKVLPKRRMYGVPKAKWEKLNVDIDELEDVWICTVESEKPVNRQPTRMSLKFQVADVKKPLISVKRIVEKGNHVGFGPKLEDNFIINKTSGLKLPLKPNGRGSYILQVQLENGEDVGITVDSGAEENVCPWEWGSDYEVKPADKRMTFRSASGGNIEHYGQREVVVRTPF